MAADPVADERIPIGSVRVRAQTLGAVRIMVGTQTLGVSNPVLFALMLRVIYTPGMSVRRDVLLRELWPGQATARQSANLRQTMYKLRHFGVDIAFSGRFVQVDRSQVDLTFSVEPTEDRFTRDITTGNEPFGPFLPGYVALGHEQNDWLDLTREALHSDVRRVLVDILRRRRQRADWSGAELLSRWLLDIDPLNEDATLTLAECVCLSGAKAEALAILDRYLGELGAGAGDIRLPATLLRKRFLEPAARRRSVALVTDKYFLGRDVELADLTLALRRARWHDGSAVLLHGPPGIGKTRLMMELSKVAHIEGYREVTMECRESIMRRPLGALLEAVPELLSTPGALGSAPESLAVIRKLLGPEPGARAGQERATPALADTIEGTEREGLPERSAPVVAVPPTDDRYEGAGFEATLRSIRAQSIRHAIVDLMAAVSDERPIFLLVEDAHWLDDASWEVVSDVIQRVGEMRVFIVLTSRYVSVREERPARMPTALTFRRLPALAPLHLQELARCIAHEHAAELPPAIEAWIIAGSEGTPLMLRALIEHWVVTGQAEGVPPTLTMLLEQRLDRLDGTAQRTLQAIGLLGKFASLDRIKVALELPMHDLIHALEQLELSGCLATSQASLVITHDLVRQIAQRRMSPLVDAAMRASIGETLEAEYGRTLDQATLLEALMHIELSGRPDALYRFVIKHEEALLESGKPSAVLSATDCILSNISSARCDRRILRMQARLMSQNGSFGRALSTIPGGVSLPDDARVLNTTEIDECLSLVEAAYRADPIANPVFLGSFAASVVASPSATAEQKLRASDIGLIISANTCDPLLASACYHGLQLSEREIQQGERTQRIGLLYHTVFGSVETAKLLAQVMFDRSKSARASTASVADCGRAGFVFRMIGRSQDAIEAMKHARSLAFEIGSPRLAEYPVWQLAQIANEIGDTEQALEWTEELRDLAAKNMDEASNGYIHGHLCLMAISTGKSAEAKTHFEHLQNTLPSIPPIRSVSYSTALELSIGLLDKNWAANDALLDVAIARFERMSTFAAADLLAAGIGESLMRLGRSNEAKVLLMDYTTKKRREQSAPTAVLQKVLDKL